jgi:predicted RNA-binding Zn-ribbon protein involved in translation (DUF1610 family)
VYFIVNSVDFGRDVRDHRTVPTNRPTNQPDESSAIRSHAPDWEQVPFDVGCARCGQDLRGLTEPKCPTCGLEFDWATAVPIDSLVCSQCEYSLKGLTTTRCPECGQTFTWEKVLQAHRRVLSNLFEHTYPSFSPSGILGSWMWSLRPGKLWRVLDMHDLPKRTPLMMMAAMSWITFATLFPLLDGVYRWTSSRYWVTSWKYPARGARFRSFGSFEQCVTAALNSDVTIAFVTLGVTWSALVLLSLLVLRQSMRQCRVRFRHVLRVWVYAIVMSLPLVPLALFSILCGLVTIELFTTVTVNRWTPSPYRWLPLLIPLLILLHAVWSLRQGYRHYIKMRHSTAVVIGTQTIAILGALTLSAIVSPTGIVSQTVGLFIDWLGWV